MAAIARKNGSANLEICRPNAKSPNVGCNAGQRNETLTAKLEK
jgi:hypothetical protein